MQRRQIAFLCALSVAAGATRTGHGGVCPPLCPGEAFAGPGTASPMLGGFVIAMAATGILVSSNTLFLLLALIVLSTCIALGRLGFDGRKNQRVSTGGAT